MLALVRAILAPKQLAAPNAFAVDAIAIQVMRAFTLACAGNTHRCILGIEVSAAADISAGIRIHEVIGSPHGMSRCIEGVLIDTPMPVGPSDEQRLEHAVGGRVLLFAAPLDVVMQNHTSANKVLAPFEICESGNAGSCLRLQGHEVEMDNTRWVARAEQERALSAMMISACQNLGVNVVISQRVINRHLQERLVKAGVIPLERLSLRHADAVARLTGARPLGAWYHEPKSRRTPEQSVNGGVSFSEWAKALGVCGAISSVHLGGQSFTLIRPPPQEMWAGDGLVLETVVSEDVAAQPVATLVLCAPTVPEMRELSAVVLAATKVRLARTYK
jgi:hypothetical protein